MGLLSVLLKSSLILAVLILYLLYAPNQLDVEPKSYSLKLFEKFDGPYAPNGLLDNSVILFENQMIGPESLAPFKGSIYTGLHTGEIIKITGDKYTKVAQFGKPCEGQWEPEICGRTLGIRITKNGILYAADAYFGLQSVDLQSGVKKTLIPVTQAVGGKLMKFPDDLAVDENGVVYMSDVSTKWRLDEIVFPCLEHENTGRIIKYDPKTGEATVLIKDLHFPNGVQLTHDGTGLLVAELLKERILKYNLSGPKKGQLEVFANVPGQPDNIRPSSKGGYWIGMVSSRNESSKLLSDYTSEYPIIRKISLRLLHGIGTVLTYLTKFYPDPRFKDMAFQIQKGRTLFPQMISQAMAIELDRNGKVSRTIQSSNPKYNYISEVLEHEGHLYCGSFINPYLLKVKL